VGAIRVPLNGLKSSLHNLLVDKISVQRFYRYSGEFGRNPASMRLIITALFFLLTLRFRRRSSLEFEVIALRHQLAVLRRRKTEPGISPQPIVFFGVGFTASTQKQNNGCNS
jgi:hypothetical protein